MHEGGSNSGAALRRRVQVDNAPACRLNLCGQRPDNLVTFSLGHRVFLGGEVSLVAHDCDDTVWSVQPKVPYPARHRLEALLVTDIVDNDSSDSPFEKRLRQRPVHLFACRVPQFQLRVSVRWRVDSCLCGRLEIICLPP